MFWNKKSTKGSSNPTPATLKLNNAPLDWWSRGLKFDSDNSVLTETASKIIAESISQLNIHHYRDGVRVENSHIEKLLRKPHSLMNKESFLYGLVMQTIERGTGYIYAERGNNFKVNNLLLCEAATGNWNSDKSGFFYSSLTVPLTQDTLLEVPSRNVATVEFRPDHTNPLNGGRPLFEGLEAEISLYNALIANSTEFHNYSATNLDLFVSTDMTLDSNATQSLKDRINQIERKGDKGIAVLTSGLKIHRINQRNLEHEAVIPLGLECTKAVCARARVPLVMMSHLAGSTAYKSNTEQQRAFYEDSLSFYLDTITTTLRNLLVSADNEELVFDLSAFKVESSMQEQAIASATIKDIATINERRAMLNLEPIEGGDVIAPSEPEDAPEEPNDDEVVEAMLG